MLFKHGEPIERPPCEHCGEATMLVRREPHPEIGLPTELRTFECKVCGKQTLKAVKWEPQMQG